MNAQEQKAFDAMREALDAQCSDWAHSDKCKAVLDAAKEVQSKEITSGRYDNVRCDMHGALDVPSDTTNTVGAVKVDSLGAYTTGHCKEKAKKGGCQLHNLHCGYPACDRNLELSGKVSRKLAEHCLAPGAAPKGSEE